MIKYSILYQYILFIVIFKDSLCNENKCQSQACCVGCLRCVNNQCKICDFERYKNINGICEKLTDEEISNNYQNCKQINQIGQCVQCSSNYYLDNNKKCQKILKPIQNCFIYKNQFSCETCKNNYVVNNGNCQQVSQTIQNCLLYEQLSGQIICKQCKKNFIQSVDFKECLINDQPNCLTFQYIDCKNCQSNTQEIQYKKTENPIYTQLDQNTEVLEFIQKQYSSLQVNIKTYNFCEAVPFSCQEFYEDLQCSNCKEDYYLDENGECQINMTHSIPNCAIQQNNICEQCILNFYLQDNKCIEQPRTILYCIEYEYNKQTKIAECIKCQEHYLLTNSKLKCVQKINNCLLHQFTCSGSNSQNCELTCTQCNDFYYLNETKACQQISIKNCYKASWLNSKETCLKCQNQYYLKSNECKKHILNQNCDLYDQFIANKCIKGISNYFPIKKNFLCQNIDIMNGEYYSQNKDIIEIYLQNCEYKQVQDLTNITCLECKAQTTPINLKNANLCMRKPNNFVEKSFCKIYQIDENYNFECSQCQDGYFLNSQNSCIKNCEGYLKKILIKEKEFSIRCVSFENDNCLTKLSYNAGEIITNTCLQCEENKNYKIDLINYSNNILDGHDILLSNESQFVNITCLDQMEGYENCEYFIEFELPHINEETGVELKITECFQCKKGYKNDLQSHQCIEDTTEQCQIEFIKGLPLLYNIIGVCNCGENEVFVVTIQRNFFEIFQPEAQPQAFAHPHDIETDIDISGIKNKSCQEQQSNVDHCSLEVAVEVLNHLNNYSLHRTDYLCVACKPNYKPIYDKLIDYLPGMFLKVTMCLEISNCDKDQQIQAVQNSCYQCSQNYVLDFYGTQKLCKDNNIMYCRIYDYNLNQCKICYDNYQLENGKCRQFDFNLPFCNTKNFSKVRKINYYKNLEFEVLFGGDYPIDYGCTSCTSSEYVIVSDNRFFSSCVNTNQPTSTTCLRYQTSYKDLFDYQCKTCTNLLPYQSSNGTCPDSQNQIFIQNCLYYNEEGTKCLQCKESYMLINYGSNMSSQLCFFQTVNDCIYSSVNTSTFALECQSCKIGQVQINLDYTSYLQTQFHQLIEIENCKTYKSFSDLKLMNLQCEECISNDEFIQHSGYYLTNNKCLQRKNQDQYCLKFEKDLDQCQFDGCIQGGFFNKELKKCFFFNSIINCKNFKSFDECRECISGYYLKTVVNQNYKNQCYSVEEQNLIEFCIDYDSNQKCINCFKSDQEQYFKTTNESGKTICQLSQAKNCKSQVVYDICQTCNTGYYIDSNGDCIKNDEEYCVFYEEDEVIFGNIQSGHCKYCENDLLSDNTQSQGKCVEIPVEYKIRYCRYHQLDNNEIKCLQCQDNFTLSLNSFSCDCLLPATIQNEACSFENQELQQCQDFISTTERVCSLCKLGYFLEKQSTTEQKICKQCSDIGLPNCMMCVIRNGVKICEVCQIGYYMNENKECIKNFYN